MVHSLDSRAALSKLARLERAAGRLRLLAQVPEAEFAGSWQLMDAAARNVEVAAQACVDLANHIIARRGLPSPSSAAEAIRVLGDEGIVEEDLVQAVLPFVRLRNRLAHEYDRVGLADLRDALRGLEPLRRFASAVAALLPTDRGPSTVREPRVRYRKTPAKRRARSPK